MPVELVVTMYGRPAEAALAAAVARAKRGDPLRPVTVVVPTHHVGVAARRSLGTHGGVAAVSLVTIGGLAELLAGTSLVESGRRPVSSAVLGAAARVALAEVPGHLGRVAGHPTTRTAVARAHRELSGLEPDQVGAVAATNRRAADVVALHHAMRRRLADGWYDEVDLVEAAVAEVGRAGAPPAVGALVVHLPQALEPAHGRLLSALAAHVPVTVVAGLTGDEQADAGVRRACQRLGVDVPEGSGAAPPIATAIVRASDPDDEVRAAVRAVVDAATRGVPLSRMAVLHGGLPPYPRLVTEHLRAAGIVHSGPNPARLADGVAGRTLLALLALPRGRFAHHDVHDLLAGAPLRHPRDGRRCPAVAWRRVSRAAGVIEGLGQWAERLARFSAACRAHLDSDPATADEPGGATAGTAARAREAAVADDLAAFVVTLATDLSRADTLESWADAGRWAAGLLDRYLDEREVAGWPADEQSSAQRVRAVLAEIASLDDIDATPPSAEVLRSILAAELDTPAGGIGHSGDGVLAGPLPAALGRHLDLVVVVGLAEGTLPATHGDDPLLPDRVRVSSSGGLPTAAERDAVQHRHLLAALAAATPGERVLCHPRGDLRRTADRTPSRWLLASVSALAGRAVQAGDLPDLVADGWLHDVPSFVGGLAGPGAPATAQEHRLRSLLAHTRADRPLVEHSLATASTPFGRGVEMITARASDRFTRFDGNLGGRVDLDPTVEGITVSPTRLETWAACPARYLFETVLGVRHVDEPDDLLRMAPVDRGALVHAVLEGLVAALLPDQVPGPDEPWTDAHRDQARRLLLDGFADLEGRGAAGRRLFWRTDLAVLDDDLQRFLAADSAHRRARRATPVAAELRFGGPGHAPVAITLGDGRTVRFRGSADRVDRTDDDGLVVIDYKSGRADHYLTIETGDDPTVGGTRLQLPVYAHAARATIGGSGTVRAAYWFVSRRARHRWVELTLDDDVAARVDHVLRTIVDGIAAGVFPAHPPPPASFRLRVECPVCDPDGLGTTDLWQRWQRKRHDPGLGGYVELVEPDGLASSSDGGRP